MVILTQLFIVFGPVRHSLLGLWCYCMGNVGSICLLLPLCFTIGDSRVIPEISRDFKQQLDATLRNRPTDSNDDYDLVSSALSNNIEVKWIDHHGILRIWI